MDTRKYEYLDYLTSGKKMFHSHCLGYVWKSDGKNVYVEKFKEDEYQMLPNRYIYIGLTKIVEDIVSCYDVERTGNGRLVKNGVLESRICKKLKQDRVVFTISEFINFIIEKNIELFEQPREKEKEWDDLGYITNICKPEISGDYVYVDFMLKFGIGRREIQKWYKENRREICKMAGDKYNSWNKKGKVPLQFYRVGGVTITQDSRMRIILELKESVVKALENKE